MENKKYEDIHIGMGSVMNCLMGREQFTGIDPVDSFCGKWDTHL